MATVTARVTTAGQVSLPAPVRRRWQADEVLIVDRGDYCIVRPVPGDVRALRGALGGPDQFTSDELRRQSRVQDSAERSHGRP